MKKDYKEIIKDTTKKVLEKLGIQADVEISKEEDDVFKIEITGDDLGILIGYHGETLRALEFIIKLIVTKKIDSWQIITLDIGSYREKRKRFLKLLAAQMAERVKFMKEPLTLSPMSSFERRIIHLSLKEDPEVATESIGEGKQRRVVVRLEKDKKLKSKE